MRIPEHMVPLVVCRCGIQHWEFPKGAKVEEGRIVFKCDGRECEQELVIKSETVVEPLDVL
jgi:hypothetical protein